MLVSDADQGDAPIGFGTWLHRSVELWDHTPELTIEIAWFGVVVAYQGQPSADGPTVATTLFATLEAKSRAHPDSTPDMPLTLEVDVENPRARRFWERLGFEYLETVSVTPHGEQYLRMLRPASVVQ